MSTQHPDGPPDPSQGRPAKDSPDAVHPSSAQPAAGGDSFFPAADSTWDRAFDHLLTDPSRFTRQVPTDERVTVGGPADPAAAPPRAAPPPGPQAGVMLGRFRLEVRLGRGGMGEVWKAHDPARGCAVVVKVLPPELRGHPAELARIRDSFRKVCALQHQHLCPVHDLGEDETWGSFLVMKFLDAKTLALYRWRYAEEHGGFPLAEAVRVLRPIAAALDYAHGQKVVHRDVKPQNIMVHADGTDPQLVDFGLAAEIRHSTTRVSRVCLEVSGTYPYMAPEQWRGHAQDGRTDQYALAAVAYELLAGRPPFDQPTADVMRLSVLNDPVPELPGQPPHVNAALTRALAKKPADRFASCAAFVDALAGAAAPAAPPPTAPARKGKRTFVAVAAAAVSLVAGWLLWALVVNPDPQVAQGQPRANQPAPASVKGGGEPPKALTAEEVEKLSAALRSRLETAARELAVWHKTLGGLRPAAPSADLDDRHGQLLTRCKQLDEYARAYDVLDTELAAKPPATVAERDQFLQRVDAVAKRKAGELDLPALLEAVRKAHAEFVDRNGKLREGHAARVAKVRDAIVRHGTTAVGLLVALDCEKYDLPSDAFGAKWAQLQKRRAEIQGPAKELAELLAEVGGAKPLTLERLDAVAAGVQTAADALARAEGLRPEAALLAADVRAAGNAEAERLKGRLLLLGKAHLQAQWFICTNDAGQVLAIDDVKTRKRLVPTGNPPFLADGPQKVRFLARQKGAGAFVPSIGMHVYPAPSVVYRDAKGVSRTLLLDHGSADPVVRRFADAPADSWQFALVAGQLRQKYVPYSAADADRLAARRQEMARALAEHLNSHNELKGVALSPEEISITWETAIGDEKEVTLKNTFGGFRIEVRRPDVPAAGLGGQPDLVYREWVTQLRARFGAGGRVSLPWEKAP